MSASSPSPPSDLLAASSGRSRRVYERIPPFSRAGADPYRCGSAARENRAKRPARKPARSILGNLGPSATADRQQSARPSRRWTRPRKLASARPSPSMLAGPALCRRPFLDTCLRAQSEMRRRTTRVAPHAETRRLLGSNEPFQKEALLLAHYCRWVPTLHRHRLRDGHDHGKGARRQESSRGITYDHVWQRPNLSWIRVL